jgi:hypothetical protein
LPLSFFLIVIGSRLLTIIRLCSCFLSVIVAVVGVVSRKSLSTRERRVGDRKRDGSSHKRIIDKPGYLEGRARAADQRMVGRIEVEEEADSRPR